QGWIALICGTASSTWLVIVRPSVVAIAAIGTSVSVETNSPIAPTAAMLAATYAATMVSRPRPEANETDVPDSSVTSPPPNRISPISTPTTATTALHAMHQATMPAYLTASSRLRPTGTASRYRNVPVLASPDTESPATTDTAIGKKNGITTNRAE